MKVFEFGKAICYSGYRAGQSPMTVVPTREQIAEDIMILHREGYRYIRMYDPNEHARRALQVIRENNLPIKALVGIDSQNEVNNPGCPFEDQHFTEAELLAHKKRNDREVDKLIELCKEFNEEIIAVSVGNENTPHWGAHMVPEERLIEHADKLRAETGKPVTFCEGAYEWTLIKELPKHLDFISVHSYPWHGNQTVDVAVEQNAAHYRQVSDIYPDKEVIFTEMGWTTNSKGNVNDAQATVANQKRYFSELNEWLEKEQIVAFLFEAFDEPWKSDGPEKSECNWGIYTVDRVRKY